MGYLRETYKSQNINPISPTTKFTLGIIQIKIKAYQLVFSAKFNKKQTYLYNFNIWLQPDLEARGVCMVKVFASMLVYTSP